MEKVAKEMLKMSMKSYLNEKEADGAVETSKEIFSRDDEIDNLNTQVQQDLIKRMSKNSRSSLSLIFTFFMIRVAAAG